MLLAALMIILYLCFRNSYIFLCVLKKKARIKTILKNTLIKIKVNLFESEGVYTCVNS